MVATYLTTQQCYNAMTHIHVFSNDIDHKRELEYGKAGSLPHKAHHVI